jgi:methyl-accepting chemotaxis protein
MRIRTKIFALVGALGLVTLAVAGVGVATVRTYDAAVDAVKDASTRALFSERLNRLVTHVVMEARGIYAAKDVGAAAPFADGVVARLDEIDALLKAWAPLVPAEQQAMFDAVRRNAASFRTFRLETVRLGREVSPQAANAQGNNDDNRANRRAFQASIDALTQSSREAVEATDRASGALYRDSLVLLLGIALGGVGASLLIGGLIGHRQIARPMQAASAAIQRLAAGDYALAELRDGRATGRRDEVGDIWRSMSVCADAMAEADRLRAERSEADRLAAEARRAEMQALAGGFEGSVGELVQHLSAAAHQMEATARTMAATADQTNHQASVVAATAEETSVNVQAVAAATEELAATANEIGSQVAQTSHAAAKAVEETRRTNARVQALAEGAAKIGDVVALIGDIAGQTNLLALNATIEAARAGEAGRGFAVVASEVKALAAQTAKATEEITAQIGMIQAATREAVEAIEGIGATIGQVHEIATGVAAAVEEQQAATQEIARNVSEAARGTQETTESVSAVQGAATGTGAAAAQVLAAAGSLAEQSGLLSREVDSFLVGVRAA